MVQGVNKEYIFENEKYIERYLEIIEKNKSNYDFTMIAHCIMNNHAHFLTHAEDIKEISKFMQKTNLLYAHMYNKEKNRVGVLFRNRYQAEPIYDIKYLINCIKYIHENPVKAKMVSKCEDYKYSSYNDYMNNTGPTKSEIMKKIFGEECDYSKLFKSASERRFIDVEPTDAEATREYILEGIREYQKESSNEISEILSNREVFKELVGYLYESCGFKYVEIGEFFEIGRGKMGYLKK